MTIVDIPKPDLESIDALTPIQSKILDQLSQNGPMTRYILVEVLKTPRTTIYDNLLKLQKRKKVEKYNKNSQGNRGRPEVIWRCKE